MSTEFVMPWEQVKETPAEYMARHELLDELYDVYGASKFTKKFLEKQRKKEEENDEAQYISFDKMRENIAAIKAQNQPKPPQEYLKTLNKDGTYRMTNIKVYHSHPLQVHGYHHIDSVQRAQEIREQNLKNAVNK